MIFKQNTTRRAFWIFALSFLALMILMLNTNPVNRIIYAFFFFALALILLISLGFFLVLAQSGRVSSRNRYRIVSISLIVLALMMFMSTKTLDWVNATILLLICFGLAFYISRRS